MGEGEGERDRNRCLPALFRQRNSLPPLPPLHLVIIPLVRKLVWKHLSPGFQDLRSLPMDSLPLLLYSRGIIHLSLDKCQVSHHHLLKEHLPVEELVLVALCPVLPFEDSGSTIEYDLGQACPNLNSL